MKESRASSAGGTDTRSWRERVARTPPAELTADIYLRSLSPPAGVHDGQVALVERLSALSSAGRLSDLRVSVWGELFCLCDTCAGASAGRAALERVEEFQRWADGYGAETSLPFERRDVHSNFAPSARESHEALVRRACCSRCTAGSRCSASSPTSQGRTASGYRMVSTLSRRPPLPTRSLPPGREPRSVAIGLVGRPPHQECDRRVTTSSSAGHRHRPRRR